MSDTEEDASTQVAAGGGATGRVDKEEGDKKDEGKEGEVLGKRVRVKKWNAVAFWSYGQSTAPHRTPSLHSSTPPPPPLIAAAISLISPLRCCAVVWPCVDIENDTCAMSEPTPLTSSSFLPPLHFPSSTRPLL
jgi:hypothetical protein